MERSARTRALYGFLTVLVGLLVLGIIYGYSLYIFSGASPPEDVSNNIVASIGAVTGVIGSIVSGYFGIQLGTAGRERAETAREETEAARVQTQTMLEAALSGLSQEERDALFRQFGYPPGAAPRGSGGEDQPPPPPPPRGSGGGGNSPPAS